MKRLLPLSLLLLTGSSMPDMVGVGEAARGMQQDTASQYFMAVLLVALLIERGLTGFRHGRAIETLQKASAAMGERFALSLDRMATSLQNGDAQAMANMGVIQLELRMAAEDRARIATALKEVNRTGKGT